ncbi:hypothetical protein CYY_007535 [Polysphondylium violaceum]|uniref:Peptidase S28 family protein n=1 Tax=Polysphondylium violaceum TaxID=133409 RepID=A0A8J4UXN1_9MYCE|nr:hypothetical protein CYY_007535 [Polysphondylium violaceum]
MKFITLIVILIALLSLLHLAHGRIKTPFTRARNSYLREKYWGEPPVFSNETLWFEQKQDNFDSTNNNTWSQKYMIVDDYFEENGPIFIYLAGEASMSFFGFQEVQVVNWAQDFKALYLVLEHRFYGDSYPTDDLSTSNLRFLTSQQALADAANFLTWIKTERNLPLDYPAVVFGCSYSGALSSWFRLKYPNLVVASVAPSGPVLAQLDFPGYYGQFSQSAAPDCVAAAQSASDQIMEAAKTQKGWDYLASLFNSCTPLDNPSDQYYFIYNLVDALGGSDQMNNPPTWILNSTCATLLENGDYLNNWATIFSAGQTGCNDFRLQTFINQTQQIDIASQNGDRSWEWQSCVEFGYFSSTYPGSSVFPPVLNVEEQVRWCSEIFGIPNMTPNVDSTNYWYGGANPLSSNVMFTNGNLDPWHLLSVNNDRGNVKAVTYQAGHCGSLIATTDHDPISLTQARQAVFEFLQSVLAQ